MTEDNRDKDAKDPTPTDDAKADVPRTGDAKADAPRTGDAKADAPRTDDAATDDVRDSRDDDAMSKLLKKSLAPEAKEEEAPAESLLPSVQRKLRQRSRGKFYGDGWSTSQSKLNYALVAVVMLLVIAVCYMALGPTGFTGTH